MNKNSQVLVFLSSQPLYQRNYDRFGIDILKKNGWRVYYFECSFIFRREFFNSYGGEKENIKFKNLIFPKNFIELYDKLESLKPKYCIDLLGNSKNERVFKFNIKKTTKIVNLDLGLYPLFNHSIYIRLMKKFEELGLKLFIKFLFDQLVYKIFKKYNNFKYDINIVSGNKGFLNDKTLYQIKAHSFDYDQILRHKKLNQDSINKENKKIVFLDQGGSSKKGDDPLFRGVKLKIDYEKYYEYSNRLLNYYKNRYSAEVVVCTHPKSNLLYTKKKFNFKVIQSKTLENIYDSDIVISYSSTAIQYAVIFNKPIVFFNYFGNFSKIEKKFYFDETKAFVNVLGSQHIILDFDSDKPPNLIFEANDNLYKNYIKNYIKNLESPDKMLWQIISDHLKKY